MQTKLLLPTSENIRKAALALKQSQPIAFATETVYGLGARLSDKEGISKIFQIKNRPNDNPLIAHICDLSWIEKLTLEIPDQFEKLAENFFPGPLTVVFPKNPDVPSFACSNLSTIAVRMPKLKHARDLIQAVGEPLVAPSANLSGRPSPTCALHVLEDLDGMIPIILDGGVTEYGLESTVVYLEKDKVQLLRPGAISREEIEDVLNLKIKEYQKGKVLSPGMKYRHYAPNAKIRIFHSKEALQLYFLSQNKQSRVILSKNKIKELPHAHYFPLASQTLFEAFRLADRLQFDEILVYLDPEVMQNEAVINRLTKASDEKDNNCRAVRNFN